MTHSGARPSLSPPGPGPSRRDNARIAIYGLGGTGKTTLMRRLALGAVRGGGCVTWIDATGEHHYLADLAARAGGYGRVVRSPDGWSAAVRAAGGRPWLVVVSPGFRMPIDGVWRRVYDVGGQLLAIDDAETYARGQSVHPDLAELVSKGRNREVSIAMTVRVPSELNAVVRGNATRVVSFRLLEPLYIDVVSRAMGRRDLAEVIRRLPDYHYIATGEDGRVTRGTVRAGEA